MPPLRITCDNCEEEPLRELEVEGELVGWVCSGASESELEARSGCGTLITPESYKERKAEMEAQQKGGNKNNGSTASKAPVTPAAASGLGVRRGLSSSARGLGVRRPLTSLHGNGLHARTSLHNRLGAKPPAPAAAAAASTVAASTATPVAPASSGHDSPADSLAPPTPSSQASSSSVKSSVASNKKKSKEGQDSGEDSEEEDDNSEEEGEEESTPSSSHSAPASPSTTPVKKTPPAASAPSSQARKKKMGVGAVVSSSSGSPAKAGDSTSDGPLSHQQRLLALKKKLALQRAKASQEFALAYGVEGDADTEQEKANAARKSTGMAAEDFFSSSQEGGIARAPLVDSLTVKGAENPLAEPHRKPFTAPRSHGSMNSSAQALVASRAKNQFFGRRLGMRIRVFTGQFGGFKPLESPPPEEVTQVEIKPPPPPTLVPKAEEKLKEGYEPLIIWQPTPEELAANPQLTTIEVPHLVCQWLRPHQREGVRFMAECVLGQRNLYGEPEKKPVAPTPTPAEGEEGSAAAADDSKAQAAAAAAAAVTQNQGNGAILADDMGLGKTLQSVGLLYTLLTQGFERGRPVASKVIIVTPTSLVSNWRNELDKWLGKGTVNCVALSEVGKDNIECGIDSYVAPNSKMHVLIVSYDTFRRHVDRLKRPGLCDLLICDEAHRLKNNKTSTYVALDSLPCRRRVLLSGTPMQNDLSEFFSMINFTNRGILGDRKAFRKYYELPILLGREPDALEEEAEVGAVRAAELSAIVNQFVLRRTNVLLKKHLPPKVIQIVCCRPAPLQVALYRHFLASKSVRRLTSDDDGGSSRRGGGGLAALPLITSLKKLVNHPKLIWDSSQAAANVKGNRAITVRDEETGEVEKVPPALVALFKGTKPIFEQHAGGAFLRNPGSAQFSGKMLVLERLLIQLRATTSDRVVIVSNFTSALDVIGGLCEQRKWDYLRLDGSTTIKKRQALVDQLSDHKTNKVFCFLLSSRAGGCGLNLIGANRLVLFDPDWNPAVDKQAAARVWRDGQQKRCFIYRFLTTGTIEEKIYQRQLSKEGLSGVLGGSTADASLTKEELKDLFQLSDKALETPSDTHDSLACDCMGSYQIRTEEEAAQAEQARKTDAELHAKQLRQQAGESTTSGSEEQGDPAEPGAPSSTIGDTVMADSSSGVEGGAEGQPAAAAAASSTSMDIDMDGRAEGEEAAGAVVEGGGEDGDNAQGENSDEEEDVDDDDGELKDFIASGSDDDDEEEYGSKQKGKKAAPKPRKKDGPRKQRKQRIDIGSLNFPQLHALTHPTLGQRGEPPEEELINWAHHATSNSIPDPIFRAAAKGLPLTRGDLPYVSFVFSCEIAGKAITNSTDADDALRVSARSDAQPVVVGSAAPIVVSVADALAKHAEFIRDYQARQKKRQGLDSDEELPDLMAHPELRRHSSRLGRGKKKDEPDEPEEDEDYAAGEGAGEEGGENGSSASRKRKSLQEHAVPLSAVQFDPSMDEATRRAIQQMLEQDAGMARKGGKGRGRPKKGATPQAKPQPSPPQPMSDIEEEASPEPGAAPPAHNQNGTTAAAAAAAGEQSGTESDVQSISPPKKRKTHNIPSSTSSSAHSSPSLRGRVPPSPARRGLSSPAKKAPPPPVPEEDDEADFEAPPSPQLSSGEDDDDSVIEVSQPSRKTSPALAPVRPKVGGKKPSIQPRSFTPPGDEDDFLE